MSSSGEDRIEKQPSKQRKDAKIKKQTCSEQRQQSGSGETRALDDVGHFYEESIGERRKRQRHHHNDSNSSSSSLTYNCPVCQASFNRARVSDSQINHHIAKCLDSPPPAPSISPQQIPTTKASAVKKKTKQSRSGPSVITYPKTSKKETIIVIKDDSNNTPNIKTIRGNNDIPTKHSHRIIIKENKLNPILLNYMNQRAFSIFSNKKHYSHVLNTKIKSAVIGENIQDAFPPSLKFLCDDFTSSFLGCGCGTTDDEAKKTKKGKFEERLSKLKHLYITFLETDMSTVASLQQQQKESQPPQLPHVDYKWSTLDRYSTTQNLPWISFFPLTKSGMKLNVWLEEGLPHHLILKFGDVAFLRGDVVHSGGFEGDFNGIGSGNTRGGDTADADASDDTNSGNRRCHIFLPRYITDIPTGNEYFEKEDKRVLLSERYIFR